MNKYRVLIIDDERLIREGLKSYIDWSALNAEVVAICADGREGVRPLRRTIRTLSSPTYPCPTWTALPCSNTCAKSILPANSS